MKQRLKHLLVRLLSLLPGKPVILLESAPPLGDNTGALYRTLLAQGWNDRYRLVWVVPDPAAFRNVHEKNVSFAGTQGKWALLRLSGCAPAPPPSWTATARSRSSGRRPCTCI